MLADFKHGKARGSDQMTLSNAEEMGSVNLLLSLSTVVFRTSIFERHFGGIYLRDSSVLCLVARLGIALQNSFARIEEKFLKHE